MEQKAKNRATGRQLGTMLALAGAAAALAAGVFLLLSGRGLAAAGQNTAAAQVATARGYLEQGALEQAAAVCRTVLEASPGDPEALRTLARASEGLGDTAAAEAAWTALAERGGRETQDCLALVGLLLRQGRRDEAKALAAQLARGGDSTLRGLYAQMDPAAPAFTLAAGSYDAYQLLCAADVPAGMTVHYTLDGSEPTAASPEVGGGVVIAAPEVHFRAVTVSALGYASPVTELDFTITAPVEEVYAAGCEAAARAVRQLFPNKDPAEPIYNYEAAQVREIYIIGTMAADVVPVEAAFTADGYALYGGAVENERGLAVLEGLQAMPFLRRAVVCWQSAPDLTPLAGLPCLEELTLVSDELTDVSALHDLPALRTLELGGNQISDIAPLAALRGLERLGLWGNPVRDTRALDALGLQTLDLTGTPAQGGGSAG